MLKPTIVELIRRSSTNFPSSWENAIRDAAAREDEGSSAQVALNTILENIKLARESSAPMCQGPSDTYEVVKGDSLWKIASSQYSNPYFWPLIYWANKSAIKDPDLIYPKQKFVIDQNASDTMKKDAEKMSRNRGPWSLYDGK